MADEDRVQKLRRALDAARDRLDAPDPSVDPRFRFTVSVPPLTYVTSARAGWDGALLAEGDSGFVRSGEARHEHACLAIQRWQTPNVARPIGARGGWTTLGPGVRVRMPGEREFGEWCGRPRVQTLFVAPERVEAVLGRSWETSGIARWRAPRHRLPLVDHVVSALLQDLAAGHPAGELTGDALVTALLLHLDGAGAAEPPPRPGALGRRLDDVVACIEEDLARPPRLAALARLAGVDVRCFLGAFTAELGCTPGRWVLLRRLERAKALLRDPERTLGDIAAAVGFADARQLWRVLDRDVRYRRSPGTNGGGA